MAIGTDALVDFFGSLDALDDTSGSVADAAFSVAGDLLAWTNDDDAPQASVTFEGDFAAAVDAGSTVTFYAQLLNVVSTNDNEVPDANFPHIILGYFPLNDVATAQFITIRINLPNAKTSSEYQFFIQNNSGQSLDAAWNIHITPISPGPHA